MKKTISVDLIRHAQTPGNALHRYIGRTDEALSGEGRKQAYAVGKQYFANGGSPSGQPDRKNETWILSPMYRCIQTAALILAGRYGYNMECAFEEQDAVRLLRTMGEKNPSIRIKVCREMRECDFGAFENRNYQEMDGDPLFRKWVDEGGVNAFPCGEHPDTFRNRSCLAFEHVLREFSEDGKRTGDNGTGGDSNLVLVVHGGTIMSILERFGLDEKGSPGAFYEWYTPNACGYHTDVLWENGRIRSVQVLHKIGLK